jgi:Rnl2 family RNA ligase
MEKFKRYQDKENHYQEKFITRFFAEQPDLATARFVAQEKLDGANFQIKFFPDGSWNPGKRSSYINEEKFFNAKEVLEKLNVPERFKLVMDLCVQADLYITLYGELYGSSIINRIDYGTTGDIRFYEMWVNDAPQSILSFEMFMVFHNLWDLVSPTFSRDLSFEEAMNFDVENPPEIWEGQLGNKKIEGIVIKPYDEVFVRTDSKIFALKKKSTKFNDKAKEKKPVVINEEVVSLNNIFRGYLNENRVLDTFSKHGQIESPKQFGEYIKYILEDMKGDFLKDHKEDLMKLDKKDQKMVFNIGGSIVNELKKYV